MTTEENVWLPEEKVRFVSGGVVNVDQKPPYISRIQPYYTFMGNETHLYGSDSSLPPFKIENSIIQGFRDSPELLGEISKVFIYFNGTNAQSAPGTGPLRYFIYAGKDYPVDIVADSNPGAVQKIIQAAHLETIFQKHYHVNFFHNSQENGIRPAHRYETRELSVSRSLRNALKQTILKHFVP